jgi:hypothetical protein
VNKAQKCCHEMNKFENEQYPARPNKCLVRLFYAKQGFLKEIGAGHATL